MLAFTGAFPTLPLVGYTLRTITDPEALATELDAIRSQGYAHAFEERELELNAIAAPVFASDGELAGIVALQGPVSRFGRAPARKAVAALLETTGAISRGLGSTGTGAKSV
jgi:DNA-binding IclR family transcriptional regulator